MKYVLRAPYTLKILGFVIILISNGSLYSQCNQSNTTVIVNSLDVNFIQEQNIFNITDVICNSCTYATSGDQSICACREDCKYNSNILEEFNDCNEICYEAHGQYEYNYDLLKECYGYCDANRLANISECQGNCGTFSRPPREVDRWRVTLSFWFTTGFVASSAGDPDDVVMGNVNVGQLPKTISIQLDDLDVSNVVISYCYQTELLILYSDGNCCLFVDFECFQRG